MSGKKTGKKGGFAQIVKDGKKIFAKYARRLPHVKIKKLEGEMHTGFIPDPSDERSYELEQLTEEVRLLKIQFNVNVNLKIDIARLQAEIARIKLMSNFVPPSVGLASLTDAIQKMIILGGQQEEILSLINFARSKGADPAKLKELEFLIETNDPKNSMCHVNG